MDLAWEFGDGYILIEYLRHVCEDLFTWRYIQDINCVVFELEHWGNIAIQIIDTQKKQWMIKVKQNPRNSSQALSKSALHN